MKTLRLVLLYSLMRTFQLVYGQPCPLVSSPCSCVPAMRAPVSIKCTGADSMETVLNSLINAKSYRIDSLRISLTKIPILKNYVFDGFNIAELIIDSCQLSDIEPFAFDKTMITSLAVLNLNNNKLTAIPAGSVSRLRSLTGLHLGKNQLKSLSGSPFSQFESRVVLSKIVLNDNAVDSIPQNMFAGLSNVRDLDLSNNRLDQNGLNSLKSALSDSRTKLTNLDLKDNKISYIRPGDFEFPNLETLTISGNGIQPFAFTAEVFQTVPKLTHLYLAGNPLMSWNSDLFRYIPNLVTLDVSGTSVTSIPADGFKYCPNLAELILSNAGIESLAVGAFSPIPRIVKISLDNNKLSRIRRDTFQNLVNLKYLFLARNYISSVDDWSWSNLASLSQLDISDNNLTNLPLNTFTNSFQNGQDQRFLYLCKNPWNCDTNLDWLRNWLRTECNIGIDINATTCYSLCRTPKEMERVPLMGDTPLPLDTTIPKFSLTTSLDNDLFLNTTAEYQLQMESATIGWIILAVILAVLLISIILLAVARYFVSKKHRKDKDKQHYIAASNRSVVNRSALYPPTVASSGYPISAFDFDLPPASIGYGTNRRDGTF